MTGSEGNAYVDPLDAALSYAGYDKIDVFGNTIYENQLVSEGETIAHTIVSTQLSLGPTLGADPLGSVYATEVYALSEGVVSSTENFDQVFAHARAQTLVLFIAPVSGTLTVTIPYSIQGTASLDFSDEDFMVRSDVNLALAHWKTSGGTSDSDLQRLTFYPEDLDDAADLDSTVDAGLWEKSGYLTAQLTIAQNGMASVSGTAAVETILYGTAGDPSAPTTVPEPTSLILMGSGLVGFFVRRKFH